MHVNPLFHYTFDWSQTKHEFPLQMLPDMKYLVMRDLAKGQQPGTRVEAMTPFDLRGCSQPTTLGLCLAVVICGSAALPAMFQVYEMLRSTATFSKSPENDNQNQ